MRATLPLRTTAVLAGAPVAALLVLAMLGRIEWRLTAVAVVVVAVWAIVLAGVWMRDLGLIIQALRRAQEAPAPHPARHPVLASTRIIIREAERLARDLAQRRAEVEAMVLTEQAILQRLPDPLIVLSADRSIRRANAAALTFGDEMGAVLRHPGLRAAIDRALTLGDVQTAELSLPVPVSRDVYATVIALQPPLADGGRVVAVLSDRTRERAVERMRADFVANASHELRTPLASLIGFIDTLRGPAADDPPAQIRFLTIMAEQAQRMNRLIDDLLSLSRIELTEYQTPAGRIDLCNVVDRLAAAFEPQVLARRITLTSTLPGGAVFVLGDEDQLDQVLQNLLDNAVKYGREGGSVRVTVQRPGPAGRWPARPGVTLAVRDDGAGIARAHIPRLTERFYRADKGRSRSVGGTGLGLAIVKHIINRHRGQMHIDSTEGEGTTVTMWLPELPSAIPSLATAPELVPEPVPKPMPESVATTRA